MPYQMAVNVEEMLEEFYDNTIGIGSYDYDLDEIFHYYLRYIQNDHSYVNSLFIHCGEVPQEDIDKLTKACQKLYRQLDTMLLMFQVSGEVINIVYDGIDSSIILTIDDR